LRLDPPYIYLELLLLRERLELSEVSTPSLIYRLNLVFKLAMNGTGILM
jgi:hypothetical protein